MDAIVIQNVSKQFRRSKIGREYSTLKTELLRWVRRKKQATAATFTYALQDVSFSVPVGSTVGLLGRNGSGKSTLLKLVTGIYSPTSGSIQVNGRVSALLDLGAGFHPDFSGRENILINGIILGLTRAEVRARMDEIIEFSELGDFIDEPVRTYSSGMFMRLAFAVAVHVDPDILIIDEILAVGDAHFARKSRAKMEEFKRRGKTLLLVTHDLGTIESWCDSAVWLDNGRLREVGDARTLVRNYIREVNTADAQAEADVVPSPARPDASVAFDVSRARWLGAEGNPRSAFSGGEIATLEIELARPVGIPGVHLKVSLHRDIGLSVWEGTSPLPPDAESVRLEFAKLPLVDGVYAVNVAVMAGSDVVRAVNDVCTFTIQSGTPAAGVVRIDHAWKFNAGHQRNLQVAGLT